VTDPVRDAVIVASPTDERRRIAGVPLLVRTALVLQRAGIERLFVDGPVTPPVDARIRVPVFAGPPADGAPRIVVGAGTVVDETIVRELVRSRAPGYERDGARITFEPSAAARLIAPPVGVLLPASRPDATIERSLLAGLENPRDGYLDRLIHRRLSPPLTRRLLATSLTPNQVTIAGVALGIAGGLLVGAPSVAGVLAGISLLLVSGVLDCVDGEMARMRFAESAIGHTLDVVGDTLVHAALLAGIALRLAHETAWPGTGTLVLLAVGVVGAFVTITWSERNEARRHRVRGAWENRVLDGVLSPLSTRDWYVFPIAFALAGRLDVLVPAAAWGAQAFWVVVALLVWRVLRRA